MDGGHAINLVEKGEKKDDHYIVTATAMPGASPSFKNKATSNPRFIWTILGKSKTCNFIP